MFYHKAKKSLGQNFLKSKSALKTIVETGQISRDDTVVEIGPGKGALTEHILQSGATLISIEKDDALFAYLSEKYQEYIASNKLRLIHSDILDLDDSLFNLPTKNYKLIANIPYNITGQIIRKFLTSTHKPTDMVLLVQKEVSDRIVARDGKESLLSLSVKLYGTPKYIKKVPARDFSPAPKVDSAILLIKDIKNPDITHAQEVLFFEILHVGFAHKRKMLIGNLSEAYDKERILSAFHSLSIDEKARAEDITLKDWIALTRILS
jgi:16S rRNA (adenine1518-N6/adenine1519-N6)-dimethyltransferase